MKEKNYNLDEEIRSRTKYQNFDEVYKTYYGLVTSIVGHYLTHHPGNIDDLIPFWVLYPVALLRNINYPE